MPTIPGFAPSTCGFHFANDFPSVPDVTLRVLGVRVGLGDAAHGLCGGMTYAVRDLLQAGLAPPPLTVPPTDGPLFDYLVARILASFDLPRGGLRYLGLMSPLLPDGETWASRRRLAPHGRSWTTLARQWPAVRDDLDHGRLCPLGVVQVRSADPRRLALHHQVLAYGYDLDGPGATRVTLRVYDPNHPDADDVTFGFDTAHPDRATPIARSHGERPVLAFFRTAYRFRDPSALG